MIIIHSNSGNGNTGLSYLAECCIIVIPMMVVYFFIIGIMGYICMDTNPEFNIFTYTYWKPLILISLIFPIIPISIATVGFIVELISEIINKIKIKFFSSSIPIDRKWLPHPELQPDQICDLLYLINRVDTNSQSDINNSL